MKTMYPHQKQTLGITRNTIDLKIYYFNILYNNITRVYITKESHYYSCKIYYI